MDALCDWEIARVLSELQLTVYTQFAAWIMQDGFVTCGNANANHFPFFN